MAYVGCFLLLTLGVCGLSSSVPRQFHVVKEQKNWTEAQQYCREKFTDLATIDDMAEMEEIKSAVQDAGVREAWIGLKHGSSPKWQWSLAGRDFYRENDAEFRNWDNGQPNGGNNDERDGEDCVGIHNNKKWHNYPCERQFPFLCYNGTNSTHPYVLVEDKKNWTDAQRYCREKHTDLASVRNQAEDDLLVKARGSDSGEAWIGLFRDAWEWSDGRNSSFRHWDSKEPNYKGCGQRGFCVEMKSSGQWNDESCNENRNFICYEDKLILVGENKTWMEALQYCRERHVDLVSVSSKHIQRWVEGWAKGASSPHVWLGLRYSCNLGFWFWVNGRTVCCDNWASDAEREPGCASRVGAVGREGGKWSTLEETKELNFICTNEHQ
ncbi:hypothetical protein ACEWY4_024690 [Coilia grayii]|uniref:C-type lectin domain-containing protein n=1 Tax=Coilia grayii TaxID=363190 RepID=A0ABD1IXA1_9TELE